MRQYSNDLPIYISDVAMSLHSVTISNAQTPGLKAAIQVRNSHMVFQSLEYSHLVSFLDVSSKRDIVS